MKKVLAIVLVLMLAVVACAEGLDIFELNYNVDYTIPEGYTVDVDAAIGNLMVAWFMPEDAAAPMYGLVINYSEEFGDYTLTDLSEEEFAQAVEVLTADYAEPVVGTAETGMGTKLITVVETGSASSYATVLTIYHGYFVQINIEKPNDVDITEDDMQIAIDILTSMELSKK